MVLMRVVIFLQAYKSLPTLVLSSTASKIEYDIAIAHNCFLFSRQIGIARYRNFFCVE